MTDIISQEEAQQIKKLKRLLEGWRMALLPLKSVLLWEQQWHPCAILGGISLLYLTFWFLDLNSLTTFAIVGLILNFIDFIVPIICNSIYGPSAWTGQQEKVYEDICKSIVLNYNKFLSQVRSFYSLREKSPCRYYITSKGLLCVLAWISSSVNPMFLLYLFSVAVFLWPGIQKRGISNTFGSFKISTANI
ncbi:ADP-ribosylation factor-like protein 6-interacting protein 1 isoform X2 [Hyposmocoma kahamanoa]|uniref:ADP-ribosylation factor-like protein 6-interacting protein 1 isoform X2 n=1 Tax=Hyposmocoma kahamanoa TaxID=1477025 RepID=UPI000E6DA144|nr:ADP-ribosylation factor-like protein 6-interacting protein 1 isoform X2 [Hyposmocoma kahamanoa]